MITLKNHSLTAYILPLGATLAGLWHKDMPNSLVLGGTDPKAYTADLKYAGAIVGPVANRIANGRVALGKSTWRMPQNEPPNTLHSGPGGLHEQIWHVTDQSETTVTLQCGYPDDAQGLPGNRSITATYILDDAGTLHLRIKAKTDTTTLMNPAHHPYWCLDGAATVERHTLTVPADTYLHTDAANIPTGQILPVEGSKYDFRSPTRIPTDRSVDGNLCLSKVRRDAPEPVATLSAPTGPTLNIASTEPGLQVYNGSSLSRSATPLHAGQKLGPFAGVALEPQGWPDAPNHAHFPSIVLHPDATYFQHTVYRIS